jgi:predicted  nucleic acid-binding Zn-ribbon protein
MDHLTNECAAQDKQNKQMSAQFGELNYKYEDAVRTLQEMDASKKKLSIENSDLSKQMEDGEIYYSQSHFFLI